MNYETVIYEKNSGIARITFNRPAKMNALNRTSFQELLSVLDDAEQDDAVRVVVIAGQGKAFCAGVDLKFARQELIGVKAELDFLQTGKKLLAKIEGLTKPVIAAVNGIALAGGFEIILAADFAIAVEDVMIGDQHMKVGMFGAGGSPFRLPLFVGLRKAKEMLLTGQWISGKEAEKIGLVNKAVPADQFENAIAELAAELAGKDPMTMRITKAYINHMTLTDVDAKVEVAMLSSIVNNLSREAQADDRK
jgi:enoyl-CoA hydratase